MKNLFASMSFISFAFVACFTLAHEPQNLVISGEVISVGLDMKVVDDSINEQLSDETSKAPSVAISRLDVDNQGMPMEVEIASGTFIDGKIALEGSVEERTSAFLSVTRKGEKTLTADTIAAPGKRISFVLLDYQSPKHEDQLLLVGDYRIEDETEAKFTISGDLSSIKDKDLTRAIASVKVRSDGTHYGSLLPVANQVLLKDGKFLFEGTVREPILISIHVRTTDYAYWGIADAIVEPGTNITISPSESSSSFHANRASDLMANSDSADRLHAKVIESWQNSPEYLAKMEEYADAIKLEHQKADLESDEEDTASSDETLTLDSYEIHQEMTAIKNAVLSRTVQDLDEPIAALLAMELGAPESLQLDMWDRLCDALDEDLASRRAIPRRTARATQIRLNANAESVIEGHIAPEFTLENLEGEEIALSDVLADNDIVLVDFWASWCGPCIEQIPDYKEIHSEYKEKGFEIVFVSIDDDYDDWKYESDKQELPWVNVGDLSGFHAATAVDYGVKWIPTEFAIKTDGSIVDRELTTEELEKLLTSHFGRNSKRGTEN